MMAELGLPLKWSRKPIARCIGPEMLMAISWSAFWRSKSLTSSGLCTPALLIWCDFVKLADLHLGSHSIVREAHQAVDVGMFCDNLANERADGANVARV